MLYPPFYNPTATYEENYANGPFNGFADGISVTYGGEPQYDFLGVKINFPIGIPAGPLLNSRYIAAAFQKGFDLPVYKTVRASEFPCHPFPNVLSVKIEGDLTLEKAKSPLIADAEYGEPLSITNSFGVPSRSPEIWQADARKAVESAGKGQTMIMSFMGTVKEGQTADDFVADFARAAELSRATGAKIYEANLSCPNIGNEGLVCYNLEMTERVCAALREKLGDAPLLVKVGYYQNTEDIEELAHVVKKYAHGVSSINTIAAPIVNNEGTQALPGSSVRLRSGVCGHAIKWAGIEMVERLVEVRKKIRADFVIVGCGGVTVPADFKEYRDAGADVVMTATGAMWNPYLARDVKMLYGEL